MQRRHAGLCIACRWGVPAPSRLPHPPPARLQAAPFVAACRGDALAGGACSPACAAKLAPFNRDCFHGVLSEDYFQTQPGQQPPPAKDAAAFYDSCFPPPTAAKAAEAPQQQKAPAMSAAGAGAIGVSSGAAPAGAGAWALLAAALAAAALFVA